MYNLKKKIESNALQVKLRDNYYKASPELPKIAKKSHRSESMQTRGCDSVLLTTPKSKFSWISREIDAKSPDELKLMLKEEIKVNYI